MFCKPFCLVKMIFIRSYKFRQTPVTLYIFQFHYKTDQGIKNFVRHEADEMASKNPDYAIQDLYNAISSGNHPSWTMHVQVMTYEQAEKFEFNPFDLTKVWSQKDFPLRPVGKLVLDR